MNAARPLAVALYAPSDNFKAIPEYTAVCFADNMGLVAVTGPADNKPSEDYAHLFALSPELRDALTALVEDAERHNVTGHPSVSVDWANVQAGRALLDKLKETTQ
jgi:hypothetical protein